MRRLLALLLLAAGGVHAASVETRAVALDGQATVVDLYLPDAAPPRGLAVIAHGFTRSRARHGVLAGRLAAEGFAVAVPDLPHWLRHAANADAIVALGSLVIALRLLGRSVGHALSLATGKSLIALPARVGEH